MFHRRFEISGDLTRKLSIELFPEKVNGFIYLNGNVFVYDRAIILHDSVHGTDNYHNNEC